MLLLLLLLLLLLFYIGHGTMINDSKQEGATYHTLVGIDFPLQNHTSEC